MLSREHHKIRPAQSGEARQLSDLALRSKAHWDYSARFLEACREELSFSEKQLVSRNRRFFVLEQAWTIIGFYALNRQTQAEIELEALFVEPEFIGAGCGGLLFEHAKSTAAGMGAEQLVIQGDPNAEGFYLAAGGVLTGSSESESIPGRFLPTFSINLSGGGAV